MIKRLWWAVTDLVAFFYRLIVRARFHRTIECPDVSAPIRVWAVPGKLVPGWASGVTIGRNVFVVDHLKESGPLLSHEIMHVRQGDKETFLFLIKYLWDYLTKGYRNIEDEVEARHEGDEYWYDHDICR